MTRARYSAAILFLTTLGTPAVAQPHADGQQIVKDILAKWEERRNAFDSIAFKTSGTLVYPKGCFTGTEHPAVKAKIKGPPPVRPPEDFRCPISVDILFDLRTGRIRREMERTEFFDRQDGGRFSRKIQKGVFDGQDVKIHEPRTENTTAENRPSDKQYEVWIQKKGSPALYVLEDYPLFHAIGYVKTTRNPGDESSLHTTATVADFVLKGTGHVNGVSCQILESRPQHEPNGAEQFWINMNQDAAILRWVVLSGSQPWIKVDCVYAQTDGYWFPQSWKWESYAMDGSGRLKQAEERVVTEISINPRVEDKLFDIQLSPKMVVWKSADMTRASPTSGIYYVGRDGSTLVPWGTPDATSRFPLWTRVALVLALIILAGALMHRIRRRRRCVEAN